MKQCHKASRQAVIAYISKKGVDSMEYTVETIIKPNAIVRIHRPILTEEERAKRMHQLMQATERFMKEVVKR